MSQRFEDPRMEWRINDVERKAEEASRRLHEIDSATSRMDSLERSLREARSDIDGLCSQLQTHEETIRRLQEQGARNE